MWRILYYEILFGCLRAFRTIVPLARDREVVSWHNVLRRLAYIIPFYFLAYLARRKDTYYMRLLMLPMVLVLAIRGTYAYGSPDPQDDFDTWLRSFTCLVVAGKALDYAFTREGHMKTGETALPHVNGDYIEGLYMPADNFLPSGVADANQLIFALRGTGWSFGKDTYVPPVPGSLQRSRFLLGNLYRGIKNFLIFDLCLTLILQLPAISTIAGGSMFYHSLPVVQRYLISTVIMLVVGVLFIAGFGVLEAAGCLGGVGIFQQDPKDWPPLMDNPWSADSLHDFWARRWHQTLRRTFLVYGGVPGQWVAGRVGMVMGSFLASACYHEAGMYLINRPFDYRVILFFFLNGVGVSLEWTLYKLTGRRVSGPLGRLWTSIFVLGLGQMLIDSWFVRGLAGSRVLPAEISPSRIWLLPMIEPWLATTVRPILHSFLH